jgi:hypothetical protein
MLLLCLSLILSVCLFGFIVAKQMFVTVRVYGRSMEPTLYPRDYLLGLRLPRGHGLLCTSIRRWFLRREAVVLVRPPAMLGRLQVKRITALTGDFQSWGWGNAQTGPLPIPKDHLFLVGDAFSYLDIAESLPVDSRFYGPCPAWAVVAWVFLRFWPIQHFSYLSRLSQYKTILNQSNDTMA